MRVDKQSAGSVSVYNLPSEVTQSPVWIVQLVAARGLQWRQMTSVLANVQPTMESNMFTKLPLPHKRGIFVLIP